MPFRLRTTVFAVAAINAIGGCHAYNPAGYDGDGQMTSYPKGAWRHDLELPRINLLEPGRHTFQLGHLPREGLLALLSLDDPTSAKLDDLERAGVRVSMTLTSQYTGEVSVKDGRLVGDWATTVESWRAGAGAADARGPVDFEGIWFRPIRHELFTLTIDVAVATPITGSHITATPRVKGGGLGNP